jgi:hypothetical protein
VVLAITAAYLLGEFIYNRYIEHDENSTSSVTSTEHDKNSTSSVTGDGGLQKVVITPDNFAGQTPP